MLSPAHHMSEHSSVLKQKRWQKHVVTWSSIILLGTARLRAAAPVIYHSVNSDAGAFMSTEVNRNFATNVHEAKIPSVIAEMNIFAFDSGFSKLVYSSACVNTFSCLDCIVISLHDVLDTHI